MTDVIRIPNIEHYSMEIIEGVLICTPKKRTITEDDLCKISFTSSSILDCTVRQRDKLISNKKKYMSVLLDIWKSMPTTRILHKTTFNMKTTNENMNGYKWRPEIQLSVQGKDANQTMKEIIHMVNINHYGIDISIKTHTGEIIHYISRQE